MASKQIKGVLVTRPAEQSSTFCEALAKHNIDFVQYPMMVIKPLSIDIDKANANCLASEVVIATSQNAITHCPQSVLSTLQQHSQCSFYAVGEVTAQAMQAQGLQSVAVPVQPSTEGLLAMLTAEKVTGRTITILGGQLPRPLLAQTLVERGALVHFSATYYRCVPTMVPQDTWRQWSTQIDTIVLTSQTAASHLLNSLPLAHQWLSECRFIVASERIALGLRDKLVGGEILVADSAYDADMLATMLGH